MAAGEDQAEPVVLDALVLPLLGVTGRGFQLLGKLRHRLIVPSAPAHAVDGFEATGGNEPRARIGRDSIPRPLLDGHRKGIVQRLFCSVEVDKETDQRVENLPRFRLVDALNQLMHLFSLLFAHRNQALLAKRTEQTNAASAPWEKDLNIRCPSSL